MWWAWVNVCAGRDCSSTWHQQKERSNDSERVRCSNGGPKGRRHVCEDVIGATCMILESSSIGWLRRSTSKNINQAWFIARVFARVFAKHRQCDVSEVMGSTRRVFFETLRRARIRLDAVASLVWRQWWREMTDSSIGIFLHVDSFPQSRGEEMF